MYKTEKQEELETLQICWFIFSCVVFEIKRREVYELEDVVLI